MNNFILKTRRYSESLYCVDLYSSTLKHIKVVSMYLQNSECYPAMGFTTIVFYIMSIRIKTAMLSVEDSHIIAQLQSGYKLLLISD